MMRYTTENKTQVVIDPPQMRKVGRGSITTTATQFSIMSYNICGINNITRAAELTMYLTRYQPSIIILQEPKHNHLTHYIKDGKQIPRTPKPLPRFRNYSHYQFKHPTEPTGIVMYIHSSCTYLPLTDIPHCTPYRPAQSRTVAGFVWISSPCLPSPIVIGGAYMHDHMIESDVAALAEHIALASLPLPTSVSTTPLPVFLLGDFNAHHLSWDPMCRDLPAPSLNKGKWLHKHLLAPTASILHPTAAKLMLVNNMFNNTRFVTTHSSLSSDSVLDLAFTTHPRMITSMEILTDEEIGSDHYPIMVHLKSSLPRTNVHAQLSAHINNQQHNNNRNNVQQAQQQQHQHQQIERKYDDVKQPQQQIENKHDDVDHEQRYNINHTDNAQQHDDIDFENKYNQETKDGKEERDLDEKNHEHEHYPAPTSEQLYYTDTSTIPGAQRGLFANKIYKRGDFIIEYTGDVIDHTEKVRRYPLNDGKYIIQCTRNRYIDADNPSISSAARYINTAGKYNNAKFRIAHSRNGSIVRIYAASRINIHDEIFMAYGGSYHHQCRSDPDPTLKVLHHQRHMNNHPAPRSRPRDVNIDDDANHPLHPNILNINIDINNNINHPPPQPNIINNDDPSPEQDPIKQTRIKWCVTDEPVDWKAYQAHIKESLPSWTNKYNTWGSSNTPTTITQTQLDECWSDLLNLIVSSALSCVGIVHVRPNAIGWCSYVPNFTSLHKAYRTARNRLSAINKNGRIIPTILRNAIQSAYVQARSTFDAAVKEGKDKCWKKSIASCDVVGANNKHKLIWSQVKRFTSSERTPSASFCDNTGHPPTSPQQAINNMAAHLARISSLTSDASHSRQHERNVMEYLNTIPSYSNTQEPPPFTLPKVSEVCTHFRLHTAMGSDNVSPYFLKHGDTPLHHALFTLYSICWRHGMIPSMFKHGHVATLYKGDGDTNDANNYRPITITLVVARIYERLQVDQLISSMQAASIPSPEQFGFTRKRSTHDAVYRLLSNIVETIDTGRGVQRYVPVVFIDISKAFDKVWIEGLLFKIHKMGITGNLFYMLKALLTNRTMQVVGNGLISDSHCLTAGVPQGSILAPFLFLIFIHGITQHSDATRSIIMSLFADDIALLSSKPGSAGINALQSTLDYMSDYAKKWKITYSAKKTNVVFFRTSQLPIGKHHPVHNLTLTNFNIKTTPVYTYLGVLLDYHLTFVPHLNEVVAKVTCTANKISRLVQRDHLPSIPIIRTLVKFILVPQMVYGFPFIPEILDKSISTTQATGNATQSNFYVKLKNVVLRPLLFCMGLPHSAHHQSVFIETRLLNIHSLLSLSAALTAHRWLSLSDDDNPTAALFRKHASTPALHPLHPFYRMHTNLNRIPALRFDPDDLQTFKDLPHDSLRRIVWTHQYNAWRNKCRPRTGIPHTLPPLYPMHTNTKHTELPMYMHIDDPKTAARRARLRFGRARLRYDQRRLGFQDITNSTCQQCHMNVDETVDHVLTECPRYDQPRAEYTREMQALPVQQISARYLNQPLTKNTILFGDPRPSPALNEIIGISAKLIHAIYNLRPTHF
jgi:hypothetical protein